MGRNDWNEGYGHLHVFGDSAEGQGVRLIACLRVVMLSLANYINQVRGILESLPPPEVIPMGMDRSAVMDKILDQLQKIVGSEGVESVRVFHGFSDINPFERNEVFREYAKESLPWAVWKTDGIKGLVKIAIEHYFKNGGPMECE
ncbi:hypothetical protein AVEN_71125-1 [Araneus ventricosus]|uniref:Uncharacterized protein n=1 Tax=Araneus ventricosus TaxID=182803 RepID=A0A4Y2HJG1_ARAVE|nr:hypothetical protein AVEN_71125-1 [Araneus ventricosus]